MGPGWRRLDSAEERIRRPRVQHVLATLLAVPCYMWLVFAAETTIDAIAAAVALALTAALLHHNDALLRELRARARRDGGVQVEGDAEGRACDEGESAVQSRAPSCDAARAGAGAGAGGGASFADVQHCARDEHRTTSAATLTLTPPAGARGSCAAPDARAPRAHPPMAVELAISPITGCAWRTGAPGAPAHAAHADASAACELVTRDARPERAEADTAAAPPVAPGHPRGAQRTSRQAPRGARPPDAPQPRLGAATMAHPRDDAGSDGQAACQSLNSLSLIHI